MNRLHGTLVSILLVLLHVLGPGLHVLQHAQEDSARHVLLDSFGCACAAHEAEQKLLSENGSPWQPRWQVDSHQHDCPLCVELTRSHGFVCPAGCSLVSLFLPAAKNLQPASRLLFGHANATPKARAPPRSLDC